MISGNRGSKKNDQKGQCTFNCTLLDSLVELFIINHVKNYSYHYHHIKKIKKK